MSTNFYLTKISNSFTKLNAYFAADVIHESLGHVPSCLYQEIVAKNLVFDSNFDSYEYL